MNRRECGTYYEEVAKNYLISKGYTIREKNFRSRFGEIDLIAQDGASVVFVEVKYRVSNQYGIPEEAVHYQKQRTICKVADYYRTKHGLSDDSPFRYDVLAIAGSDIRHYENAFYHIKK